jgi:hypothetical protein
MRIVWTKQCSQKSLLHFWTMKLWEFISKLAGLEHCERVVDDGSKQVVAEKSKPS